MKFLTVWLNDVFWSHAHYGKSSLSYVCLHSSSKKHQLLTFIRAWFLWCNAQIFVCIMKEYLVSFRTPLVLWPSNKLRKLLIWLAWKLMSRMRRSPHGKGQSKGQVLCSHKHLPQYPVPQPSQWQAHSNLVLGNGQLQAQDFHNLKLHLHPSPALQILLENLPSCWSQKCLNY